MLCAMCFSQLPMATSSPWCSLAWSHITAVSASINTWHSPSVFLSLHLLSSSNKDSIYIGLRAHATLIWPHLKLTNWLHLQQSHIQIKVHSEIWGLGLPLIFLKNTVKSLTMIINWPDKFVGRNLRLFKIIRISDFKYSPAPAERVFLPLLFTKENFSESSCLWILMEFNCFVPFVCYNENSFRFVP